MRAFQYYLYGNPDMGPAGNPADDPRRFLNGTADGVVYAVLDTPPGECGYASLCEAQSSVLVNSLIHIGLLCRRGGAVLLNSPVIVADDAEPLARRFATPVSRMADRLEQNKDAFYGAVRQLRNGFSPEVNLYHLLCGHVLDGLFLDFLAKKWDRIRPANT